MAEWVSTYDGNSSVVQETFIAGKPEDILRDRCRVQCSIIMETSVRNRTGTYGRMNFTIGHGEVM